METRIGYALTDITPKILAHNLHINSDIKIIRVCILSNWWSAPIPNLTTWLALLPSIMASPEPIGGQPLLGQWSSAGQGRLDLVKTVTMREAQDVWTCLFKNNIIILPFRPLAFLHFFFSPPP